MFLLTHEFIVAEGSDHVRILACHAQIPNFLDPDFDHFALDLGTLHLKGSFLVPLDLLGHVVAEPHLVADHAQFACVRFRATHNVNHTLDHLGLALDLLSISQQFLQEDIAMSQHLHSLTGISL